jgi:lysophospholipase L1-like esterase/pimeloyl-ACP methyl ester carboxylesterase
MATLIGKDSLVPDEKRIVFVGDSITDQGLYIAYMDAYFRLHWPDKQITLINLGVSSETASGLSEPAHPFQRPCIHDRLNDVLQESRPDWVVIGYGMNDGIYYPFSEDRFEAYKDGIHKVVNAVRAAGAMAIVMTPPPFDAESFNGGRLQPDGMAAYSWNTPFRDYNETIRRYAEWLMSLGSEVDGTINSYAPLMMSIEKERRRNPAYSSGDGIHPDSKGHWVIAKTLLSRLFNITLEREPDYVLHPEHSPFFILVSERHRLLSSAWKEHVGHTNPNKADALPLQEALAKSVEIDKQIKSLLTFSHDHYMEQTSSWNGYVQNDFYLNGREGTVICPDVSAEGKPYVWRAEFLHAFDYADRALLEQGWHIVYYRLSHMYGCPYAVSLMNQFQLHVETMYSLSSRAVIFGFSRGGLYAVNYAAAYPLKVGVLYLDAPVLDIRSWPGGQGEGACAPANWEECLAIYGIPEFEASEFKGNPLDKLKQLTDAGIPVIVVAGDADRDVPFLENAAKLIEHYRSSGGLIESIIKPGVAHHPHSLENPQPIVKFIAEIMRTS